MSLTPLLAFRAETAAIAQSDEPALIKRKSRDMSMSFSPILKEEARGKLAELVVMPRTKAEVIAVAAAAARHRIAVMPRGAGTCNWGQGIPLAGGIVLDMTGLDQVIRHDARTVRVEPGANLEAIDRVTQASGYEMRVHPSTRRTATIGGFVGGGHVGIGSCNWGIMHDRGNIVGLEVVSVSETPEIVELRGRDVNLVHHTYGTTGIITELELPLAPAYAWREAIVDFADLTGAARFAITLNTSDGIIPKLVSINQWPYPSYFRELAKYVREGRDTVHVMVADNSWEAFVDLVEDMGGTITYEGLEGQGDFGRPLYEFSFGHSRWHANRVEPDRVANIGIFPHDDLLGSIERVARRFGDLGPLHLDMKRMDGRLTCQGSPLFVYRTPEHMAAILEGLQEEGVQSANTHTMHVKENGMRPIGAVERAFRRRMDPLGLMNPGKFEAEDVAEPGVGAALPTSGWAYQQQVA
jgi:FAD/FMN-containing dehydrogenase